MCVFRGVDTEKIDKRRICEAYQAIWRVFLEIRPLSKSKEKPKIKLHPCNKTLNSRNLRFAKDFFEDSFGQGPYVKDSFEVSFGFRTLWRPRLIKDLKYVHNHWFYHVFTQK